MDAPTIEKIRDSIKNELKNHVYRSDGLHKNIFRGDSYLARIDDAKIIQFLIESELYDDYARRWKNIPDNVDDPQSLGLAIYTIINAVFEYFEYDETRFVWLFHADILPELSTMSSRPCISIVGPSGNNFVTESVGDKEHPALRNCITPVIIKTFNAKRGFEDIIDVSSYSRHAILSQHNRNFIFNLVISEVSVQLCMFDRSGVCHSEEINFHVHAVDFVRILLGVSSPDYAAVGFDTSIYWHDDCRWLNFLDDDSQVRVCKIVDDQGKPYFNRDNQKILGRGTHCWRVFDDKGNDLLVKDQWTNNNLELEKDILECTKGIAGLSQLIAIQTGTSTARLRGIKDGNNLPPEIPKFNDRSLIRTVYWYAGKPLTKFDTREEVLYGIRDAIAAHQRLWDRGVLHRDVSINNVLIGPPGSPVHWRGILIDLDKAARLIPGNPLPVADCHTGTRKFQSVGVLRSHAYPDITNVHDHLYDLEAFFYCFCTIVWGYESSGTRIHPVPLHLQGWDGVPSVSEAAKWRVFADLKQHRATPFFGAPFDVLVFEMGSYLLRQYSRKGNVLQVDPSPFAYCETYRAQAALDYQYVLELFDVAADALKSGM